MFCTTECWDCEDKTCEHYVSKTELYFENQKLEKKVERLNRLINILENEIISTQICEYGDTIEEAKEYLQKLEEGIKNETDK